MGYDTLAELEEHRMVQIVVLLTGQRPPRNLIINLEAVAGVSSSLSRIPGPQRTGQRPPGLRDNVVIGHAHLPVGSAYLLCEPFVVVDVVVWELADVFAEDLLYVLLGLLELIAMQTRMVLLYLPLLVDDLAVGKPGEVHDDVCDLLGLPKRYILVSTELDGIYVPLLDVLIVELFTVEHYAVETVLAAHKRPKPPVAVVDVGVIPLCYRKRGHRHARDGLDIAVFPILDIVIEDRLRYLAWRIMHQRRSNDVLDGLREVVLRKLRELLGQELEAVPVALGLPVRRNGCAHRMYV